MFDQNIYRCQRQKTLSGKISSQTMFSQKQWRTIAKNGNASATRILPYSSLPNISGLGGGGGGFKKTQRDYTVC